MPAKNNDAEEIGSQENIKASASRVAHYGALDDSDFARGVMPPARVIDPERCNGCLALKCCSAIVPGGAWNPAPGNGVKACPGVR
jgi:hypothetical protein